MNQLNNGYVNSTADSGAGEPARSKSRFSEWARRMKASDRDAFTALFQSMSAKLVRYAKTITRDEASAYDILQDVFLKLWEMRERLNPDSSLQSLLYTMTRNAAINMNRKNNVLVYSGVEGEEKFEMVETTLSKPASMDARLDAQQLAKQLYQWIDELPERRKEAFVLSRHHDLSHKEISNIMGLSERTVNTHIFLALKHLRARLDALQNAE